MQLEQYLKQVTSLCIAHNVKSLYAFGSVLTSRFSPSSDIDFLVDFSEVPATDYVDNYISLKEGLNKLFNRPIDLLESSGIRNKFLKANIDRTKKLIYG